MTWQTELSQIYKELDQCLSEIAPECRACGECCHFDSFGHVLYASSLEVDYLLEKNGPPKEVPKNVCPYLVNNSCTAREGRTLGCRIFFCQKDWQDTSQDLYHIYFRRIKELSIKYQLEWRYAPMLSSLGELKEERVEK
jgi:hypothetical protein